MTELWQFTKLIRSKNAGPFELTFDVMFKDRASFNAVVASKKLSKQTISQLYGIDPTIVRLFEIPAILTIKFSLPRQVFSGDVNDTDVYGGQFHGPLVRLPID